MTVCKSPHPLNRNESLYFMADVPHLLKNLRAGFTKGNDIIIPDDIVKKECLPGNRVTKDHIWALHNFQKDLTFKLASQMRLKDISPAHFDKMDVGSALRVFHHKTAAALRELVFKYDYSEQLLVTAWFIDKVYHWFKLMTSRDRTWALSYANPAKYTEAIESLIEFRDLFQRLQSGKNDAWAWKPWQTGVILSTSSILELQDILLKEGLPYVLTARFTQAKLYLYTTA